MNADFVRAIAQLAKEKHISPDVLYSAVEEDATSQPIRRISAPLRMSGFP